MAARAAPPEVGRRFMRSFALCVCVGVAGAQPLAATMNGAACLAIEVDPARVRRRIHTGYLDTMTENPDDAWRTVATAREQKRAISVGLVGNCADLLPEMVRRGWIPD